jgi:tetratricopeptide (TPR) repeat protein
MSRQHLQTWALALAVGGAACKPAEPASPAPAQQLDADLTADQTEALAQLARAADEAPGDVAARRASGLAHMRLTLAGMLQFRDRAELDLEAAFDLDPHDALVARSLGRFYNLRAVQGDGSKAARQVQVYAALLGDAPVSEMNVSQFSAWSFSRLGVILQLRNRGNLLGALAQIKQLEAELSRRLQAQPDDVELHALAGNFAFFFAGNVPFDRRARVQTAVEHFEVVRRDWERMRAGARHPEHCPNTRENFMFELAEGYLVLGRRDEAAAIHRELTQIREPYTRAKEQIAFVSAERLDNAPRYDGDLDLMPPWPSDAGNCVVCHAWTADIPMDSLHAVRPLSVGDIPRRESASPIPWP